MGRQILFFSVQADIDELVEEIIKKQGIVIYENGDSLSQEDLNNINDRNYRASHFKYSSFFIKLTDSNIKYNYYTNIDRKCLNTLISEVIDFNLCRQGKELYSFQDSRLWICTQYYNEQKNLVKQSKPILALYNSLVKFIKKQYTISKDKFAYMGPYCREEYLAGRFIPCNNKVIIEF